MVGILGLMHGEPVRFFAGMDSTKNHGFPGAEFGVEGGISEL